MRLTAAIFFKVLLTDSSYVLKIVFFQQLLQLLLLIIIDIRFITTAAAFVARQVMIAFDNTAIKYSFVMEQPGTILYQLCTIFF